MQNTFPHIGAENSLNPQQSEITSFTEETDILSPEEFSKAVFYHVHQYKTSHFDAIFVIAAKLGIDINYDSDMVKAMIDDNLMDKLTDECRKNGLLKDINTTHSLF
jgi:hypothetical protein